MKVFITGGNGFIGRRVTEKLLARGVGVRWASRSRPSDAPQGVDHVSFDVADGRGLPEALAGCTHVIHLAAREDMPFLPADDPDGQQMFVTNVLGTEMLLAACLAAGIQRVVVVTSIFTCGWNRSDELNDGSRPVNVAIYRSPYVLSRFQQEYVCLQYVARGLPVIIAAPSIVVGAGDTKAAGPAVKATQKGIVRLVPPGGVNCIDVDDVAQGLVNALVRGRPGVKYPFVGPNVSWEDFFKAVARELGKPAPVVAPAWMVKLAMLATRFTGWIRGRQRAFAVGAEILCSRFYFSGRLAVEELGLPQTPVDESIRQTVEWVRTGQLPVRQLTPPSQVPGTAAEEDLISTQKTR